jgi:RHS repeat-associated protein
VTDVFGQVVSYAYDASSNRTQLSLNSATSATYEYDVINRLTQLTDNASLNTTFAYDPTNKLTSRTLPNGVVTTSQYDGLNRLTRLTHAKGANTLADFQYQFNVVSNITQMIDSAGAHNYTYDSVDRLTGATHPNQTNESYTYDDVGNRSASNHGSSYTYQAFNRLVAANGASFGYDTNGNLTSKTDASGSWTYTWDYENRLKQATLSGGVAVNYSYDALGRRVQRASSTSGTTTFVYDGSDVVRDLDGNGNPIADYLNGPGIDNKLRQTTGGTASYFVTDHLGTTRALTDSSGNITSSSSYDSFGSATSGSALTRYTYTGREIDFDTGLIYHRTRWYDPQDGRFISEDPVGFEGGVNFYVYVDNMPLRYTDPFGLQKYSGDLNQLCDTDDCELLLKDILILEVSLHIRDYVERAEFGGKLDKGHEDRIKNEDAKLKECYARYFAKCPSCGPPRVIPLRKPNYETADEARMREKARYHRNIAVGAGAAGAFALAGVVAVGGVVGALVGLLSF